MFYYYWQAEREAINNAIETGNTQYITGDDGSFSVTEDETVKRVGIMTAKNARERTSQLKLNEDKGEKVRGIRI